MDFAESRPGASTQATPPAVCRKCGKPLPADAPMGNCPACLLRLVAPPPESSGPEAAAPRSIGEYDLVEEIARGGMGVVWRARQANLNREVALKMILAGPFATSSQVRRFLTEAKAAAGLDHPNIVPIYEVGEEAGRHFYTMKLLGGGSLAGRIHAGGRVEAREAAGIVATIARAIHFAHQRGILHRDLKPSNILLDAAGGPHVADFGLARFAESDLSLTRSDAVMGSPAYMAPEQAAGRTHDATVVTDVYSLGTILYELVTGRPPFQGETSLEILRQVLEKPVIAPRALNPALDRDLEVICIKCLQKEPVRRYASAQELADDLERWVNGVPIHARPISALGRLASWTRRKPALAGLAAALSIALVAGAIGVLWQWGRAESHARELRLEAYGADIFGASEALRRGEVGRALSLLAGHAPAAGEEDLRGFEWRHFWSRCQGNERRTMPGHEWIVTRVAFSADGRLAASASMDKTVRVWDVERGTPVAVLSTGGGAWTAAFVSGAPLLITGSSQGNIQFWDTQSWRQAGEPLPGQLAAVSPDGSLVAAVEANPWFWIGRPGKVTIWDRVARRPLASPAARGRFAVFAEDSRTLAFVGDENKVHIYDCRAGRELGSVLAGGSPWELAFSPDGRLLSAAGWNETAEIWDWRAGKLEARLVGHEALVWCAVFSPDGSSAVTASADQRVRIWDTASWKLSGSLRGHLNEVWCAAFSRDGHHLATGGKDQLVNLWPMPMRPEPPPILNDLHSRPVLSADGNTVFTQLREEKRFTVLLWDAASRQRIAEAPGRFIAGLCDDGGETCLVDPTAPAFEFWGGAPPALRRTVPLKDPDPGLGGGRSAWAARRRALLEVRRDGVAGVWDASTGQKIASWTSSQVPVRGTALSPDGRWAVYGPENELESNRYGTIVREIETGRERQLLGHRDFVEGLAFSPDGRVLATGGMDATIQLWDFPAGTLRATLAGHLQDVGAVAFSPDGHTLASLSSERDLKLWDLRTGRELASIALPGGKFSLLFSPDGRWLAANTRPGNLELFEAPPLAEPNRKFQPPIRG